MTFPFLEVVKLWYDILKITFMAVAPFQFPLPQVTTWKLLVEPLLRWEHSQDFSGILYFGVYLAFLVNSRQYILGLDKSFFGQTESSLIVVIVRLEGFPGFMPSNLQSYQNHDNKIKTFLSWNILILSPTCRLACLARPHLKHKREDKKGKLQTDAKMASIL